MYKIDLHTHSFISRDGGITKAQYIKILESSILDFVAITDHNEISFAKELNKELGKKIIVGEEISSLEGEIIGLFLDEKISEGQSAAVTIAQIKSQNGLVYIPHPFEKLRAGLNRETLNRIIDDVDILEVFNARGAIRGKSDDAYKFVLKTNIAKAASSDAHCVRGVGSAFGIIGDVPDRITLVKYLKSGKLHEKYAPIISYLCPSYNKLKNKFKI